MTESPITTQDGFRIDVSPDRMKATLVVDQNAEVSASAVISKLKEMKLARFDDGMVIEAIQQRKGEALSMEIAAGTAHMDDRLERVEYRVPVPEGHSCLFTRVVVGQVIAIISPGSSGTDGVDIFGQPVERKKCLNSLQIGRNLQVEKGQICSQIRGNLRLHHNVLSVEPLLEIRGDDDSIAPVNFDGDAAIKGSVNEGRSLQITGSLTVSGALEAIQLKTGGSVLVQGGIIGKQKGRYVIGDDLRCRFITGGFIVVGKDVFVQSDITDSRISCGGRLVVDQGVIFGGAVAANSGLSCQTLGHPSGTPTLIEAGEGVACRSHVSSANSQIDANRKRIGSIRATIQPLVKMMKTLTAMQREKVTELLYEADELESATNKLGTDLENQIRIFAETAHAEVRIEKVVYPGVTVRFPTVKATFTTALKGPFSIEPRKSNGVTEVVLISGTDQSKTTLPSQPVDLAAETISANALNARAA
jgi:uncharacterized protein (DUF342 family)